MTAEPVLDVPYGYVLGDDGSWERLRDFICERPSTCVKGVLAYLKERGAEFVLIENEYLDRDFTSEFSAFYSLVFKRHRKICRRLHFFAKPLDMNSGLSRLVALLEDAVRARNYLGYVVVRPLTSEPIGRTVLSIPAPTNCSFPSIVRATHETHLLGVDLAVEGAPFMQQDARVGACAHASIWMAARHLHVKHREGWFSTVDIASHASKPTDTILASSLPAGSGGLSLNNMIRAVRAMGREPVVYLANEAPKKDDPYFKWSKPLRPEEIISRYVDSGIPVIIAISGLDGREGAGHAATVFGDEQQVLNEYHTFGSNLTSAIFCRAFYVNDDQRGCYLKMSVKDDEILGGNGYPYAPYSVLSHVYGILVPLPGKVYIKAEIAEAIAWSTLDAFVKNEYGLKEKCDFETRYLTALCKARKHNRVIARTYLTYGWKYKKRIKNSSLCSKTKELVLLQQLPRFVWITEFGLFDHLNVSESARKRIVAHAVIDATTGQSGDSGVLIFHAPSFIFTWTHDRDNDTGPYKTRNYVLPGYQPYLPRIRGHSTFSGCRT